MVVATTLIIDRRCNPRWKFLTCELKISNFEDKLWLHLHDPIGEDSFCGIIDEMDNLAT